MLQGNQEMFFKVCLELDLKNMVTYLSFDPRSIKYILDDRNSKYFSKDFPLFYMDRTKKSAIDVAMDNNLFVSAQTIIDYVVKHQNNFVFNNLFKDNLINMLFRGVHVEPLLESQILNFDFEYDQWANSSCEYDKVMAPYNLSILKLRFQYPSVFRVQWLEEQEDLMQSRGWLKKEKLKYRKIKYSLNILPSIKMGPNDQGNLIDALAQCDDLDLFDSKCVQDFI
jgi:hypothetical protein